MPMTLRFGNKGSDVRQLQSLLNSRLQPSPNLPVDGVFGPKTLRCVQRFQADKNLAIDGIVGPRTWSVLNGQVVIPQQTLSPSVSPNSEAPWMAIAQGELGVERIPGSVHNPRIVEYHSTTSGQASSDETPWCSAFANWCMKQAGISGTDNASAISWKTWGYHTEPKYGAITVIYSADIAASGTSSGNHVGFLIEVTANHYKLLGGNQSHKVKVTSFPKGPWILIETRWPNS